MFDENHKHNFNKSMKIFIERQLYSDAAHYGLIDTHPTIICGPEATRTHMIATRSGVAGTRGATNRIKHLRTYYYNTGGGHMLSGIIIYK